MKKMIKKAVAGFVVLLAWFGFDLPAQAQEQTGNKIHFINSLESGSDAIILESNGHFAMIDTGEDYDFPEGDAGYPMRIGTTMNSRYVLTDRVLRRLEELGVQKLDFILLTHVHSDHMGNTDEIIDKYPVGRVYMKRYDDSRITDKARLWDNQYVYDNVLQAAAKKGVSVLQDISKEQAHFTLGEMDIQLYNYENQYGAPGVLKPIWDDNSNSVLSVITVNGQKIYLGGDLDNVHGGEDTYGPLIGKVDMMKLNHHGESTKSNKKSFVEQLSPKLAIVTRNWLLDNAYSQWLASKGIDLVYASGTEYDATVFAITPDGFTNVTKQYNPIPSFSAGWHQYSNGNWWYQDPEDTGKYAIGWKKIDGKWYFFNSKGVLVEKKWQKVVDTWYYLNQSGEMVTGWNRINNKWYHFQSSGAMSTGWLKDGSTWYYLDSANGDMKTGWAYVGNKWYYLRSSGAMSTGWLKDDSTWYYLDSANGDMKTGWAHVGNKWYYLRSSGAMSTGWLKDGSTWYYLDSANGDMRTGWAYVGNKWYYLNSSGAMVTGWFQVGSKWYYAHSSGELAVNTTIGSYRVDSNGEWVS